jgi:toxin ParE1/3/4
LAIYRFRPAAQKDLREIARFTSRRWGPDQRRKYMRGLYDRVEMVAARPELGIAVDWIRPGLRRAGYASHVIFYRATDGALEVVRVLHANMDFEQHLR